VAEGLHVPHDVAAWRIAVSVEALRNLRDRLVNRDAATCGDAPRWMISEVLVRIERFLREHASGASDEEVRVLMTGGMRFLGDAGGVPSSDYEALGRAMLEVLDATEKPSRGA
jgi:hypothetical protein